MAFTDKSIIHANIPPQPTFLQQNKNLNPITTQFGTNTGTLHTHLLPNITLNNNNNANNHFIVCNEKPNENDNKNLKLEHKLHNPYEPLSSDVLKLKHKLRELIEYKYNFKDSKTRKYFSLCAEFHRIYTEEYVDKDIHKPLGEITVLGQTLYLLSIYELECDNIQLSHEYIISALKYWRCANKCSLRMGTTIKPKYKPNKSLLNEIFCDSQLKFDEGTNFDPNDMGFYWPQIMECYIMAGNIFLKHCEYDTSNLMYRTALELCHCMEGRYHFGCIDSLEYLMTLCIMRHNIEIGIIYCKEIINILTCPNNILTKNEYKYINTKALYSCLLRLSNNKNNINKGYKLKEECIKECINKFGKDSGHLFNLYIYFIKHCIQQSAEYINESLMFIEADEMINHLSNVFTKERELKYYEEYWLCDLFEEYLFVISEQAITHYGINASNNNKNNNNKEVHHHIQRLNLLYPLHIKHINNLNKNPMSKQHNRNCTVDKIKIIACYSDTFEAYQDVKKAQQLRQQIAQLQQR